ncbi:MAG: ParB N-terminal domain-containing protein [Bacteroidaceae bacterium]|nr:ParB N-terminal domain-containing protein [Bacteroidaceae bacterium]
MEIVKFADIKPASYNPRKISEEAFVELKGSLKTLGFILPIIVNKDNMTIVAGHQRTKAATAIGIESAPAYFVSKIDIESEVMFNQVHNGVENEPAEHAICKNPREYGKFYDDIPCEDFEIKGSIASIVKDMCGLIVKYGDALCAIVCGNEVVFGNNYIKAAATLGIPVHCYFLDKSYKAMFDYYFARDYGVFNYEHIDRNDFVQGLAQPPRHKGIDWSVLYRQIVPYLFKEDKRSIKVLDFGCGKAMFINKLKKEFGYRYAIGLEFFNHNTKGISIEKGQEMVTDFVDYVKENGLFDYTICDAVVNSVNTQKAEDSVFACLNLFTKMGGRIFVSGRSMEVAKKELNLKRNTSEYITVKFFDENGLTAIMREGQWFFQKFLNKEDVDKILERFGFEPFMRYEKAGYWGFGAYKTRELSREEYIEAVNYEFNLKLPNNQSYNRHEEVKQLFNLVDEQQTEGEN